MKITGLQAREESNQPRGCGAPPPVSRVLKRTAGPLVLLATVIGLAHIPLQTAEPYSGENDCLCHRHGRCNENTSEYLDTPTNATITINVVTTNGNSCAYPGETETFLYKTSSIPVLGGDSWSQWTNATRGATDVGTVILTNDCGAFNWTIRSHFGTCGAGVMNLTNSKQCRTGSSYTTAYCKGTNYYFQILCTGDDVEPGMSNFTYTITFN